MMDIINILRSVGAVLTDDHFVYTSGKHGSVYVNKDALYPHTELASMVGKMFAERYQSMDIDVVVGPALGGIILSQWTAYHLSILKKKEVFGVYTEKNANKHHIFTRGYDRFVQNKRVLVVEDLTTTGGSVLKVVERVRAVGGRVAAVAVMVNRNPELVNDQLFDAPFSSLGILKAEAFDEASCPFCAQGIPVNTTVGHGRAYLESKTKSVL